MLSYLRTILHDTEHVYIEKLSLLIKTTKGFGNTYQPHSCWHTFHTKEGAQSLYISIMNHDTQTEKVDLVGFDITWQTPSQA